MTLRKTIELSDNKRHDLSTWISRNFQEVSRMNNDLTDKHITELKEIYNQLIEFARYTTTIEDTSAMESHYIANNYSQLLSTTLYKLKHEFPGAVYDAAELMSNILAEECVALDDDDTNKKDDKKSKSKKKSNSKKLYIYTFSKDLATISLIQLFEIFSESIHSLVPLLFSTIFKNLKKLLEKSKYFHATYSVSLLNLYKAILRNCKVSVLDSEYTSKFSKISRSIFEDLYEKNVDYPVEFISTLIECSTFLFKQDNFIKEHFDDILPTLYIKFWEAEYGIYGFSNDATRIHTAKALAEILFNYSFSRKLISMNDSLKFYVKVISHSNTRDIKIGCFESIVHYIILNYTADKFFLQDCKYLHIVKTLSSLFIQKDTNDRKVATISRWLKYFNHMHTLIFPFITESSKNQMLFKLLKLGGDYNEQNPDSINSEAEMSLYLNQEEAISNQWFTLIKLNYVELLLTSLSSSFVTDDNIRNIVKENLINLSTIDSYPVRLHSITALKVFLAHCPELLTEVIEQSLEYLSSHFKQQNKLHVSFAKLHGHGLIIATIIDSANKDYVSYELIMRISVFASSFIKNHTTSTGGDLYFQGLVCWILMIGLMNYKDDQYLTMQKSQLFVFWKVLLTHSFTYRNEDELYRNLEIRTHALTCLLTFLNNTDIDRDIALQVSYLLTKCSNFNHSVTLKSKKIDIALLNNENRIIQIYLKLEKYIRNDFNSSLLLLIMKNFSDPNLYLESSSSVLNIMKKIRKSSIKEDAEKEHILEYKVDTLLRLDDDFAYGLSSKISETSIINLTISTINEINSEISGCWKKDSDYWFNIFESDITCPVSSVLSNDSLVLLFGQDSYANGKRYMPKVTTSLIDFSMELFSSVFPYLNSKIQFSLIENLNLAVFSKATTLLRTVAVAANTCTALHNTLRIIEEEQLKLDITVGNLIIESLKKIEFNNDTYLTVLKSDCIGLICAAIRRNLTDVERNAYVGDQINILIKTLADIDEPFSRMLHVLSLSSVFCYNIQNASFDSIFDVIFTMIKDPHPVVHSWSLKSLSILLKRHTMIDMTIVSKLFPVLEQYLSDPSYGIYGRSTLSFNYNVEFNSHDVILDIVKILSENIGPNFNILKKDIIESFQNICIGAITSTNLKQRLAVLGIYEDLSTFKIENIFTDSIFIESALSIINDSLLIGLGSAYFNPTFATSNEVIPNSGSILAAKECFQLFEQLFKLGKSDLFVDKVEVLSWRFLAMYPSSFEVSGYFSEWLRHTDDDSIWFDKLFQMINMSNEKLFKSYFRRIDDLLEKKAIKQPTERDLQDDEEQGIDENDTYILDGQRSQLSDDLQWRTKKILLNLMTLLCINSQREKKDAIKLVPKIPNLIKIAFQASTTRIESLNKLGLSILDLVLRLFSPVKDIESPELSVLEQHEAQITSALMPAFHKGSSPDVLAMAINVGAAILYSNIVPSARLSRIYQLLVKLLENLNDDSSSLYIGEASVITKRARSKIELAILNSWAKLIQHALVANNSELVLFTRTYWDSLVPFWIISLREYMILKYEGIKSNKAANGGEDTAFIESKSTKLELYEPVWLNFIKVLSSIIKVDSTILLKSMNNDDLESFTFVLCTRCIEEILRNIDNAPKRLQLLSTLHNILESKILLPSIMNDDIFLELIAIFNRLISTGTTEERSIVVDIINDIIESYTLENTTHKEFLKDIDKLYALLRLLMSIISTIIPFIKITDIKNTISENIELSQDERLILLKTFSVFESNINTFDDVFKIDLYSCLLFVIGRIYSSKSADYILPIILPLLKSVTLGLMMNDEYHNLLNIFYGAIEKTLPNLNINNQIATFLILATNGFNNFTKEDIENNIDKLFSLSDDLYSSKIIANGLRNVVLNHSKFSVCEVIIKIFLQKAFSLQAVEISGVKAVLVLDILMVYAEDISKKTEVKLQFCFKLYLLFTLGHLDKIKAEIYYNLTENINKLAGINRSVFKDILSRLLDTEHGDILKDLIENEIKTNTSSFDQNGVALKTFE